MRALLVGGGRPGLALTRALTADGHAVRFVTRNELPVGARNAG